MKKVLINFSYIFLLSFGMSVLISTYRFNDMKSGLLSILIGGTCVLLAFLEVLFLCKRGFFDE